MALRIKEVTGEQGVKFVIAVDENDVPQSLPLTDKPENRRIIEEFIRNTDCRSCGD